MKLDFLKNPSQRIASGKMLPIKQVEAIIMYGRPEQRALVVKKILPNTYGLCLNSKTQHLVLTLLDHCDNLARVELLYHIRRKVLDLANSAAGNVVLQKMIEKVPKRQRKEIAEAFVLNTEEDEFLRLSEHAFGNYVAQKLMEYPECIEVLEPRLLVDLRRLSQHPYGMRVVARYVGAAQNGWKRVVEILFPQVPLEQDTTGEDLTEAQSDALDRSVESLFAGQDESLVLSALQREAFVPAALKDAICAHLCEYAEDYLNPQPPTMSASGGDDEAKKTPSKAAGDAFGLPDFGTGASAAVALPGAKKAAEDVPTHVFAYSDLLEKGDDVHRQELWAALAEKPGLLANLVDRKETVPVLVAAMKFYEPSRKAILRVLKHKAEPSADAEATPTPKKKGGKTAVSTPELSLSEIAKDPRRTLILRAVLEVDATQLSAKEKDALAKDALPLATDPAASPVLQKLLEIDGPQRSAALVYAAIEDHVKELAMHPSGSFLVQAVLQHADDATREKLVQKVLAAFDDLHEVLSYAQGSRVLQKLLTCASDEVVAQVADKLLAAADAEIEAAKDSDEKAEAVLSDDEDGEQEAEHAATEEEAEGAKRLTKKEQRELNRLKHYAITSHAIVSYALHAHACYAIQTLLRETRSRQLDAQRKALMNHLKPFVFQLSTSPWAGRVVLETMTAVGSASLAQAMKNVVFLRAEEWLSGVSEKTKNRGSGFDLTVRETLKRQREESAAPKAGESEAGAPKKKKSKKIHRSLKK